MNNLWCQPQMSKLKSVFLESMKNITPCEWKHFGIREKHPLQVRMSRKQVDKRIFMLQTQHTQDWTWSSSEHKHVENGGFNPSKLTWFRNRRNTSLTQSSDLFSRCMIHNYVSDFLSNQDYPPHCSKSFKPRSYFVWCVKIMYDRKYVTIIPFQIWAWARLANKDNFRQDIYPGKFHNNERR